MGFSLFHGTEFFVFRKMQFHETKNHPLCGCASIVIQKITFPVTIKLFGLILQKGKVIYGKERIFTHTQKNGCVNTISSSRISKEEGTDERI